MLNQGRGIKMHKIKICKQWRKPVFATISAVELKKHIQAASRSGGCALDGR